MTSLITKPDNLRAIALMTLAMGMFALEDMAIKKAASNLGVGQIIFILGASGAVFFITWSGLTGQRLFDRRLLEPWLLARTAGEVIGTFGFVTALSLMSLSNASAILQATPLVVTMGAALFLGEPVGWRRWSAVIVGFIGVLLIIQPGMAGFSIYSGFALIGVVGLAIRDVATRQVKINISTQTIASMAYTAIAIPAFFLMMGTTGWRPVTGDAAWWMLFAVLIGVVAYFVITTAVRLGEISAIAPFRYSRLLFALIIGYIAFGEVPDLLMIIGSTLVVGSGVYAIYRERKLRRTMPTNSGSV